VGDDDEPLAVAEDVYPIPLVLVAPLAVNMSIYDLFPNRSLVRYLRAKGFELYLIDWGTPGWAHNHYDIATYFSDYLPSFWTKFRLTAGPRRCRSMAGALVPCSAIARRRWMTVGSATWFWSAVPVTTTPTAPSVNSTSRSHGP